MIRNHSRKELEGGVEKISVFYFISGSNTNALEGISKTKVNCPY